MTIDTRHLRVGENTQAAFITTLYRAGRPATHKTGAHCKPVMLSNVQLHSHVVGADGHETSILARCSRVGLQRHGVKASNDAQLLSEVPAVWVKGGGNRQHQMSKANHQVVVRNQPEASEFYQGRPSLHRRVSRDVRKVPRLNRTCVIPTQQHIRTHTTLLIEQHIYTPMSGLNQVNATMN